MTQGFGWPLFGIEEFPATEALRAVRSRGTPLFEVAETLAGGLPRHSLFGGVPRPDGQPKTALLAILSLFARFARFFACTNDTAIGAVVNTGALAVILSTLEHSSPFRVNPPNNEMKSWV